ncbi:hypothetical protein ACFV14_20410 [Streptomyces zaomyceticus]|uniref:hypothetical protein n=1 Tax=Streptomyces zaomyceticus TaxID=68286 RepID=UPI003677FD93
MRAAVIGSGGIGSDLLIDIVFDATSAAARHRDAAALAPFGRRIVGLTPTATPALPVAAILPTASLAPTE